MTVEQARREFPHTWSGMVYLNHAAVAPLSFRVRDAVDRYMARRALKGIEPYPWAVKMAHETRVLLAQMLHARADQVAFVMNTSDGLNIIAQGLDWQPGDRVLLNDLEFPTNLYPFLNLKRRGVEANIIKSVNGKITPKQIEEAITPKTKLLSISHVQYRTGAKADLTAIGKICRERNIFFVVDAIQSLPHCSIDVERDGIDFLASGSHKWMMAGEGAAYVYASDRALGAIHQPFVGWTSVEDPFDPKPHIDRLRHGAARFENGTINYPGIAALNASLKFFNEFGLEKMERAVLDLSGYLIQRFERQGIEVITPTAETERAGIVSFNFPEAEKTFERLEKQNIILSFRSGILRASPHFYNTEEELKKLVIALFE
jgi:cysteine desulfurase/selenocysteine lyase